MTVSGVSAADQPGSGRFRELANTLELDRRILAALDWSSGALQVNMSHEDFFAALDAADSVEFLETITHEVHHALQLGALGYLYRFAVTLDVLVGNMLARLSDGPDVYDQIFALIDEGFAQKDLASNVMTDLYRKSDAGISVVGLVEGAAQCVQKREQLGYDGKRYERSLASSGLPDQYTGAYRAMAQRVGHALDPVRIFPLVANLSLCSHSPPEMFEALTDAFAKEELTSKTNLPEIIAYASRQELGQFGFSWDFPDAFGNPFPRHEAFGRIRDEIREDGQTLPMFLFKPEMKETAEWFRLAVDIVMFNPEPDPLRPGFRQWPMISMRHPKDGETNPTRSTALKTMIARGLFAKVERRAA